MFKTNPKQKLIKICFKINFLANNKKSQKIKKINFLILNNHNLEKNKISRVNKK